MGITLSESRVGSLSVLAGQVEGELCYSTAGRIYSSFNGIPYARPPVGARRLLKPEAPESWEGVRKCNKNMTFIQLNAFRSVLSNSLEPRISKFFCVIYFALLFICGK